MLLTTNFGYGSYKPRNLPKYASRNQERSRCSRCPAPQALVDPHSVTQNAHLGNGGENDNRNLWTLLVVAPSFSWIAQFKLGIKLIIYRIIIHNLSWLRRFRDICLKVCCTMVQFSLLSCPLPAPFWCTYCIVNFCWLMIQSTFG